MHSRHTYALASRACICMIVILRPSVMANGQDQQPQWDRFRGPNGQGIVDTARIPVDFSRESVVLWKTATPPGHSSPVIWNDRIFFTASEPANEKELVTLCVNRENGNIMWRQTVQAQTDAKLHPRNHPAASTPAVDEKHVYVYFGRYGLICYDHEGNTTWDRKLKTPDSSYGVATSPILYKDTVILVLDNDANEASRLLAVNQATGETVWEQPRPLFKAGWSTPMIWRHGDTDELVVLGSRRLTSYNPSRGQEIWWARGFPGDSIGIPITGGGLLFASTASGFGHGDEKLDTARMWKNTLADFDKNRDAQIQRDEMTGEFTIPMRPELTRGSPGYGLWDTVRDGPPFDSLMQALDKDKSGAVSEEEWNETFSGLAGKMQPTLLAVRPGATQRIGASHIAWEVHQGIPEVPSLLYCRGRLYLIRDGGLLTCLDASTGKELFRERIGAAGQYLASPIAAGDRVLVASVPGVVTVIQAEDKLNILTRKDFGEQIFATPAIAENRIYLRTAGHFYAIGE